MPELADSDRADKLSPFAFLRFETHSRDCLKYCLPWQPACSLMAVDDAATTEEKEANAIRRNRESRGETGSNALAPLPRPLRRAPESGAPEALPQAEGSGEMMAVGEGISRAIAEIYRRNDTSDWKRRAAVRLRELASLPSPEETVIRLMSPR
jgi:hypothetical protein